MIKLGDKIKQLRLEKGIRQDDLAAAVGITKSSVSNYERNQRSPQYDVLYKIAEVLGVPIAELLTGTTAEKEDTGLARENQTDSRRPRRVTKLMAAFEKLSNEAQMIAIERIEELTLIPKYQVTLQESLQRYVNNKYLLALDIPKDSEITESSPKDGGGCQITHIILKREIDKKACDWNFYYYQSENPAEEPVIEQIMAEYKGSWTDGPRNVFVLDNLDDYNLFYSCNENRRHQFEENHNGSGEPPEIPLFLIDKETWTVKDSDDYGIFRPE